MSDCVVRWVAWPCSLCSRQRVPDSITRLGPCGARLRSFLSLFFFFCTLQRESASSVSARVHVSVGLDNNYWAVGATKWSHWPREEPGCQAWRLEGKKWQNGKMETGWRPRSLSWGLCGAQLGEDDDAIGPDRGWRPVLEIASSVHLHAADKLTDTHGLKASVRHHNAAPPVDAAHAGSASPASSSLHH